MWLGGCWGYFGLLFDGFCFVVMLWFDGVLVCCVVVILGMMCIYFFCSVV